MSAAVDRGMVLALSLWGGSYDTMSWLDKMTGCEGACDLTNSSVRFSNFRLAASESRLSG